VIARIWRGWTRAEDEAAYVEYLEATGAPASRGTAGNRGFYILHRVVGDRAEFVTMSLWDSLEAVHGFAGDDVDLPVFFPEDDRFLVSRELTVSHYELVTGTDPAPGA
jgi:heme-degrading monooxygenase HmoA